MAEVTEADWLWHWQRADVGLEAQMIAQGVRYLTTDIQGERWMAPLGSPTPPGAVVELVGAS